MIEIKELVSNYSDKRFLYTDERELTVRLNYNCSEIQFVAMNVKPDNIYPEGLYVPSSNFYQGDKKSSLTPKLFAEYVSAAIDHVEEKNLVHIPQLTQVHYLLTRLK